jgi:hypothetical protein
MKKLSTFALLLLAFAATAANAQCDQSVPEHSPTFDHTYTCTYAQGPWTNEQTNGGWSIFTGEQLINPGLIYGTEVYRATIPQGQDNRRIAFAKPKNFPAPADPYCEDGPNRTVWEFTIANGIQCTNATVRYYGRSIVFSGCSNGKTRVCSY